jgi:cob(I)alamin adenosyltransferase
MTESATAKGLTVEQIPKTDAKQLKQKVQRYSPDRLLRQKLVLPAATTVSAEKHKGRVMVRFEMPQ